MQEVIEQLGKRLEYDPSVYKDKIGWWMTDFT